MERLIFSRLFWLSNKLYALGSKPFGKVITIKQWLVTAVIAQFGEKEPKLSDIALLIGSSHQNVKEIILKLSKKGFINIKKDAEDFRSYRLELTEEYYLFITNRQEEIKIFLNELFKDFSNEDIELIQECFNKLHARILKMEVQK